MFEQDITQGPGTGTLTTHTLEIVTMLLVAGLLGLWLGWILWNRYKQTADKLRVDLESQIASLNALTAELNGLKSRLSITEADNAGLRNQVSKLSEENRIFRDQLAETGEDLSETQQRNRQLETELGLSYQPETPTPEAIPLEIEQKPAVAETPAKEETAADTTTPPAAVIEETPEAPVVVAIDAEQPVSEAQPETPEKPEETQSEVIEPAAPVQVPPAAPAVVGDVHDDLTVVEGIGPKIQELLYQYGITSYRQLAETDVARIKEILAAAGPQLAMHDPGTWPSQANLAANDQWENLKSIQGFLKGGKKPT